uniref:Uncharacterized protein n=1 Tax=Ixodes ricinus TaxID=34613 RepID=A0A6B0TQI2_IXORI
MSPLLSIFTVDKAWAQIDGPCVRGHRTKEPAAHRQQSKRVCSEQLASEAIVGCSLQGMPVGVMKDR